MDYAQLRKELLIAMRGTRTQGQLNRRLGVSFNKVYRWESGHTQMTWEDFRKFCVACRFDLSRALWHGMGHEGPTTATQIMRSVLGPSSALEHARELGFSRFMFSRWLRGKQSPPLERMLFILHKKSPYFLKFLDHLTEGKPLVCLRSHLAREQLRTDAVAAHPWVLLISCATETEEYRKNPNLDVLARRTRLSKALIETTLRKFKELGVFSCEEGRWTRNWDDVLLAGDAESARALLRYSLGLAQKGLKSAPIQQGRMFHQGMFSVDEEALPDLRACMSAFAREMLVILRKNQRKPNRIVLFNMLLTDMDLLHPPPEQKYRMRSPTESQGS